MRRRRSGQDVGRRMRTHAFVVTVVLMTALAAGIALVPLLIGADEPGKEILHPVAVTIFGGLVSATLLDALTPTLFLLFGLQAEGIEAAVRGAF